jgi:hypothetical protein
MVRLPLSRPDDRPVIRVGDVVDRVADEFKQLRADIADLDRRLALAYSRTASTAGGVDAAAIAALFADSGTIDFVYSPGAGTITAEVQDDSIGADQMSVAFATNVALTNLESHVAVARINSAGSVASQSRFNFIEGTGIDLELGDDPTDAEVDVTLHTGAALTVPFHIGAPLVLTDQTSAVAHLGGGTMERVSPAALNRCTSCRLVTLVTALSASANTPRLRLRYVTGFTTTIGAYSTIGTSVVEVSLASTGMKDTGWIPLVSGAKNANATVTVDQIGGDGAADPAVTSVIAYFR